MNIIYSSLFTIIGSKKQKKKKKNRRKKFKSLQTLFMIRLLLFVGARARERLKRLLCQRDRVPLVEERQLVERDV